MPTFNSRCCRWRAGGVKGRGVRDDGPQLVMHVPPELWYEGPPEAAEDVVDDFLERLAGVFEAEGQAFEAPRPPWSDHTRLEAATSIQLDLIICRLHI